LTVQNILHFQSPNFCSIQSYIFTYIFILSYQITQHFKQQLQGKSTFFIHFKLFQVTQPTKSTKHSFNNLPISNKHYSNFHSACIIVLFLKLGKLQNNNPKIIDILSQDLVFPNSVFSFVFFFSSFAIFKSLSSHNSSSTNLKKLQPLSN